MPELCNTAIPAHEQVPGGMHIAVEIILRKGNRYIALRRPDGIPNHETKQGDLYFCHDLMRYGESMDDCVRRIVKEQAGVRVISQRVFSIESIVKEDPKQWALIPHIIAEVEEIPQTTKDVTEVILFDGTNIPSGFAWWSEEDIQWLFKHL